MRYGKLGGLFYKILSLVFCFLSLTVFLSEILALLKVDFKIVTVNKAQSYPLFLAKNGIFYLYFIICIIKSVLKIRIQGHVGLYKKNTGGASFLKFAL